MKAFKWIVIVLVVVISMSTITMTNAAPLDSKIGTFTEAEKIIYVNGQRVQGYLVEEELAICIEDLKYCGFNGIWDSNLRRGTFDYVGDEKSGNSNEITKSEIEGNSIVETDIEIFLADERVNAYSTNGYSLVKVNDLKDFAVIEDDEAINITMNDETLNKQVEFKDEKLEQIIRKKLNQPFGSIYQSSLKNIESIVEDEEQEDLSKGILPPAGERRIKIESLDGIEYLSNLKELELISTIEPEDVEFLKKLSNLKKLTINMPQDYEPEFLRELNSLEEINIDTNASVEIIGELKNLKKLSIKTRAYDLSPLTGLNNLTELSVELCNTRNPELFKFLKDLKSLKTLKLNIDPRDLMYKELNKEYFKELNNVEEFELDLHIESIEDIEDLSYLKEFTSLTRLDISTANHYSTSREVVVIKGTEYLRKLKELWIDISDDLVTNNIDLRSLTKLEKLYLSRQPVEDLEPLKNMSNLKELYILENKKNISSFKALEELKELKKIKLSVDREVEVKKPNDVSTLGNLLQLESVEIPGYKIDDISWIRNLKSLKVINLSGNDIIDISAMENLKNINVIDLSDNNITDISVFRNLNSIEEVDLSTNQIQSFDVLNNKEKLKILDISINEVLKMPKDFYLPNLEVLNCVANKIHDVSFNKEMKKLKIMGFSVNSIKTINGSENISNVEQLGLRENNITNISFLDNIINLKQLDFDSNNIQNIDVLSKLSDLKKLAIAGNEIDDISPIFSLVHLNFINIDGKNKDTILNDGVVWEKLPELYEVRVDFSDRFFRHEELRKISTEKNSKTTYKGRVYLDDEVKVPEEGLVVSILHIAKGGMGGSTSESVIKEIVIPHNKKSVEYEFDVENISGTWRLSFSIDMEVNNDRYELKTDTDFECTDMIKNQVINDSDIEILERAKVSGKLILDDEILDMKVDDTVYNADTREIAIYARINGDKRRAIASAGVKQKEVPYELYLPKEFKGKELTLEYVVKKNGFFDFIPHVGVDGEILLNGFLTEDKVLTPNIDEGMNMIFEGEDMVIDDIFVEM